MSSSSAFRIIYLLIIVYISVNASQGATFGSIVKEADEEDHTETSRSSSNLFNFASATAGAVILDKSPASAKGYHNLLTNDKDKYGISPCNEKKWVVIGLSEDIQITSVSLANYEKYSSLLKEFQLLASGSYPTTEWIDLGTYTAEPKLGEQTFNITQLSPGYTRYLKVKFLTHYLDEALCTLSQIKVHGLTIIASLKQEVELSQDHFDILQMLNNEEKAKITSGNGIEAEGGENQTSSLQPSPPSSGMQAESNSSDQSDESVKLSSVDLFQPAPEEREQLVEEANHNIADDILPPSTNSQTNDGSVYDHSGSPAEDQSNFAGMLSTNFTNDEKSGLSELLDVSADLTLPDNDSDASNITNVKVNASASVALTASTEEPDIDHSGAESTFNTNVLDPLSPEADVADSESASVIYTALQTIDPSTFNSSAQANSSTFQKLKDLIYSGSAIFTQMKLSPSQLSMLERLVSYVNSQASDSQSNTDSDNSDRANNRTKNANSTDSDLISYSTVDNDRNGTNSNITSNEIEDKSVVGDNELPLHTEKPMVSDDSVRNDSITPPERKEETGVDFTTMFVADNITDVAAQGIAGTSNKPDEEPEVNGGKQTENIDIDKVISKHPTLVKGDTGLPSNSKDHILPNNTLDTPSSQITNDSGRLNATDRNSGNQTKDSVDLNSTFSSNSSIDVVSSADSENNVTRTIDTSHVLDINEKTPIAFTDLQVSSRNSTINGTPIAATNNSAAANLSSPLNLNCHEMLSFAEFQAKTLAKLSNKTDDYLASNTMSKDHNVFRHLMQRIKHLEMNYIISEMYISQMSECMKMMGKESQSLVAKLGKQLDNQCDLRVKDSEGELGRNSITLLPAESLKVIATTANSKSPHTAIIYLTTLEYVNHSLPERSNVFIHAVNDLNISAVDQQKRLDIFPGYSTATMPPSSWTVSLYLVVERLLAGYRQSMRSSMDESCYVEGLIEPLGKVYEEYNSELWALLAIGLVLTLLFVWFLIVVVIFCAVLYFMRKK